MMCDYVLRDYHSYQYYLRLQKGDKVLIRTSMSKDVIVEIADDNPTEKVIYHVPNSFERLVKYSSNGSFCKERTCLMLFCDSIQKMPLGVVKKLPNNFNPLKY